METGDKVICITTNSVWKITKGEILTALSNEQFRNGEHEIKTDKGWIPSVYLRANIPAQASEFTIDGWGGTFKGFTFDDRWNGWACPYFTKEVAQAIVKQAQEHSNHTSCPTYFWEDDKVMEKDTDGTVYTMAHKTTILTEAGLTDVWPVGAYNWIWWDESWNA